MSRGTFHVFDADVGWRCLPGLDARYSRPGLFDVAVRVNSRGLRDEEIDPAAGGDLRRVLCLGDSTVWGYGVGQEEMVSSRLERELGDGWQTINFGVNGYGTVQELILFESEGVLYRPRWTVLFVCENDFEDNTDEKRGGRPVAWIDEKGELRIGNRPVRRQWKSPVTQWLRHHSRLFAFVEYRGLQLRNTARQWWRKDDSEAEASRQTPRVDPGADRSTDGGTPRPQPAAPPRSDEALTEVAAVGAATAGRGESRAAECAGEEARAGVAPATVSTGGDRGSENPTGTLSLARGRIAVPLSSLYLPPTDDVNRVWRLEAKLLERLRDSCRRAGTRLLLVHGFDRPAVDDDLWEDLARLAPRARAADRDRPARRMAEVCDALGILQLDLGPTFRSHPGGDGLLIPHNGHWNAAGHALAARAVAARIREIEDAESAGDSRPGSR